LAIVRGPARRPATVGLSIAATAETPVRANTFVGAP
jgi:hypothetical protein